MEEFFLKINSYQKLTPEAEFAWMQILKRKEYKKGSFLVKAGDIARNVSFVSRGLFSQYWSDENEKIYIKRFFSEGYFAASTTSLLSKTPSVTTIQALENSIVWEYDFGLFKALTLKYPDIAAFYIHYMERHWIIEKEPEEIGFRQHASQDLYEDFIKKYAHLIKRIKKHHIASYLGITPTQVSRIFSAKK
ncbi:Crp/Fnr family transcriptional regulator [Chitinophaga sp. RCC_12]|uniref:Crp/Fnr family transcriptional regulator n=1 Tax=Chitinophaga sp. RCC_12 TaxID=3239226 RepID=UPI0035238E63